MSLAIIVVLLFLLLILIGFVYQLIWGTPLWINLAVLRLTIKTYRSDPEGLTQLGVLENSIIDFHSGRLTDASPAAKAKRRNLDREGLTLIRRYSPDKLEGQNLLTFYLMRWYFKQNLSGHRFQYHWYSSPVFMGPYPVNHVFGEQINLINFLTTYHQIQGKRSLRRYLKRLNQVAWKLTGLVDSIKMRENFGVIPPRFVLERSIAQIDAFLGKPIREIPLYTGFIEKITKSSRLSESTIEQWGNKVQKAIEESAIPAYEQLRSTLAGLLENAPEDDGVWRLPDGEAYYAFLLRTHTTTDLTPDEIHQLGVDEVARLTEEIQVILRALGLPGEDPGDQLKLLSEAPQYHYLGEDCKDAIIRDYQAILDEINQKMPEIFNEGALEKIVVKPLPEFMEADSPIAYAEPPAMDGSRPGTVLINLREPQNICRWGMRTLAYHEGIPGHVYQMAQAQKLRGLPAFRRIHFFNTYIEGWALYAEQLGWELNLGDDLSNLGRLQAQIWRAARLVVDTGIHHMRWTREEAIQYMLDKTGLPVRDVITEVERYIVAPGQACAYAIGYLKISGLRKKAELVLGENFNIKEFHDVVINNGSLPLFLLERVVDDYIDRASGLK